MPQRHRDLTRRTPALSSFLALASLAAAAPLFCAGQARADIAYKTEFTGLPDGIEAEIRDTSQLVSLDHRKPASIAALRDRARRDLGRLKIVMESQGYYDADLDFRIDPGPKRADVIVTIHPGPQYRLGNAVTEAAVGAPGFDRATVEPARYGLAAGTPATAAAVVDAQTALLLHCQNSGYPFARIDRQVTIDTATKTMSLIFLLDTGPRVRFGTIVISGLRHLNPAFVRHRILWSQGAVYDQRVVEQTRQSLIATGLFGAVAIDPARPARNDGSGEMRLRLTERARRSFTAGAGFDTSEGIEATLGWEHRDLFGHAEDLKTSATIGQTRNAAEIDYKLPDFHAIDRDFIATASLDNEIQDAFRTIAEKASIGLDWHHLPGQSFDAGLLAEHARINEITDTRTYTLVGLPLAWKRDRSNDALNPTAGYRLTIGATPYLRALGSNLTYVQIQATVDFYRKIDRAGAYVLAEQTSLGATLGASRDAIPKDHRFYAGGGGSVRGFGYQKAGPMDQFDNSIGGRSLFETSFELRIRVTPSIGLVPFVDAGSDYSAPLPSLTRKLYEGAGIGLRYYTAIGPVRFDLAAPINRHLPGDSPVQVYVSLGQAF